MKIKTSYDNERRISDKPESTMGYHFTDDELDAALEKIYKETPYKHIKKKRKTTYYSKEDKYTSVNNSEIQAGLYCVDTTTDIYHLKGCYYSGNNIIDVNKYHILRNINKICPRCYRRILISLGADDYNKQEYAYLKLYNKYNVPNWLLNKIYATGRYRTKLRGGILYFYGRYDDFKIDTNYDIKLYHNNYHKINNGETRVYKSGYHEHTKEGMTIIDALKYVANYKYDITHVKENKIKEIIKIAI